MFRHISIQKVLLALFPVIALPAITYFRFNYFSLYEPLIAEDGLFETLQFTFYFLACYLYAQASKTAFSKSQLLSAVITALASTAFFFVALEEISWGQRIFNIQNPEYFQQHNIQYEISFHNLDTVQPLLHWAYLIAGLLLSFAGVLVNWIYKEKSFVVRTFLQQLPPVWLSFYFLPLSMLYAILMFYKPFGIIMKNGVPFMLGRDQELVELFLTVGLAINAGYIYFFCQKLRTLKQSYRPKAYFLPRLLTR